jgi:hypothetical protein
VIPSFASFARVCTITETLLLLELKVGVYPDQVKKKGVLIMARFFGNAVVYEEI